MEIIADIQMSESHDLHVLAVDDSIIDRKVIERLLKITSCRVTAVDSGRRALQYLGLDHEENNCAGLKVDMIITDYCMPGMTGYELLKKIKGSSAFREVPVVIMSSENIVARIDRCLEEGAEDFIVKPVQLSDVKRLKDYMFGEDEEKRRINKRKLNQILVSSEEEEDEQILVSSEEDEQEEEEADCSHSSSPSPSSISAESSLPSSPIQRLKMTTDSD